MPRRYSATCASRLGVQYVSRSSLRRIASYSGTTFLIIVAGRLRFKTDALVIGTFVSAAAVTLLHHRLSPG